VRLPKGFGKNYFTLRAITATSNQVTLNANTSRVQSFHMLQFSNDELEAELEEEELAATLCPLSLSSKPCHCNCYFFKKTRKTLLLHPNQNYFFNYFKNLNNAISPPKQDFSNSLFHKLILAHLGFTVGAQNLVLQDLTLPLQNHSRSMVMKST
jgi:hypothetical protein